MPSSTRRFSSRRSFLGSAAGLGAAGFLSDEILGKAADNVNSNSRPSDLKITDVRVAVVNGAPFTDPLVRIDTNQGVYGLGEQRCNGTPIEALRLKEYLVGENPCNIEKVFRKIRQHASNGRNAGGVSGIEIALCDLTGKAYNIPVYRLLGGKYRDKVRLYCDTPEADTPESFATKLKARRSRGFTWMKMDLGTPLLRDIPGTLSRPVGQTDRDTAAVEGEFTAVEITPKGIEILANYVAKAREALGMEIPLSADHFGHIGVNSCIRLGKALEPYNMAWLEDMVPWYRTKLLKEIKESVNLPLATGEDIYLADGFFDLASNNAVDIAHPDLCGAGGIFETKRIADLCQHYGIPSAFHCAASPIGSLAAVHAAAASETFLALEHHSADIPWWQDLVEGIDKPLIDQGFIKVPEKPGLGVTLNEDLVKKHLYPGWPGEFDAAPELERYKGHVATSLWT